MSAVPQSIASASTAPTLALGQALIAGKIVSRRRVTTQSGQLILTLLKLAAPDEFTAPQTIEVRSASAIGQVGDTWRGKVEVGGFGRSYDRTDETGEKVKVQTAEIRLTVVA